MTDAAAVGGRRAGADVAVQVVGRLGNLALGVVVTLVLVRALGTRSFGQWSTILAVTQIAANFGELGLEQVTVSRAAADPNRREAWLGALLALRVALALPVTLVAAAVIVALSTSDAMRAAGLLLAGTLIVGAPTALRAAFQLRVRNDLTTALVTVNSVLWGAAVVLIAAGGGGMVAFAAAFLAVAAVTSVLYVGLAVRWSGLHPMAGRALWRELARVGTVVGIAGIITTAYVRIDQILVFQLAGAREAGLYGAAYRILDQIQFLPVAAMTTLMPIISAVHKADVGRARRLFTISQEYLAMVSLPALAFTIAAAEPVMRLLFGPSFTAAAPALPILIGAFVVISASYPVDALVIVLGLQRRLAWYAAAALVVNVALNLALVPAYGFLAAAWATLATELVVFPLALRLVTRAMDLRFDVGRLARIAGAAAIMGGLVAGLRAVGLPLGVLIGAAAASYICLLVALRGLDIGELRALIVRRETP
jgi:O-antigen/teichoic acid export membrane protein